MKASMMDRGQYYRGLLVLIGRDRIIDSREHTLIMEFGKTLDFDERFCRTAISDLLENRYISSEPIVFEEPLIAECFLKDALKLAYIDREIHSHELSWLKKVARANQLSDAWLEQQDRNMNKTRITEIEPESFEIHKYV